MELYIIIYWITLTPLLIISMIIIYNYFTAPKLKSIDFFPKEKPFVSVLIPARNEEKNIGICLDCLVKQTYKNLEILVLDDESKDQTSDIVENYSNKYDNVKSFNGETLPEGWLGKNWACYQLSKKANGEILLFIDADVRLDKNTIRFAVSNMQKYNIQMLSSFPAQVIASFGEYLLVPLVNWLLLSFLPLRLVYSSLKNSFAAANGQFIMLNKKAYLDIGGHEAVKSEVVEDMELAKVLKNKNYKIMTVLGHNSISCKMYNNFKESFNGFSKNFFPGFKINSFLFIIMLLFFEVLFLLPFVLLLLNFDFILHVILILLGRILLSIMSMQNLFVNFILHPLQMVTMFFVGLNSVIKSNKKTVEWKGRRLG